jgi:hypothetical protein
MDGLAKPQDQLKDIRVSEGFNATRPMEMEIHTSSHLHVFDMPVFAFSNPAGSRSCIVYILHAAPNIP